VSYAVCRSRRASSGFILDLWDLEESLDTTSWQKRLVGISRNPRCKGFHEIDLLIPSSVSFPVPAKPEILNENSKLTINFSYSETMQEGPIRRLPSSWVRRETRLCMSRRNANLCPRNPHSSHWRLRKRLTPSHQSDVSIPAYVRSIQHHLDNLHLQTPTPQISCLFSDSTPHRLASSTPRRVPRTGRTFNPSNHVTDGEGIRASLEWGGKSEN